MGYRQVIDKFALHNLIKSPNIPDYHLMIGSAENHEGLPLLIYQEAKIPTALTGNYKEIQKMTSDDISNAIAENNLEINDLNWNLALIGSGLGV